jgi:hypothetical protein
MKRTHPHQVRRGRPGSPSPDYWVGEEQSMERTITISLGLKIRVDFQDEVDGNTGDDRTILGLDILAVDGEDLGARGRALSDSEIGGIVEEYVRGCIEDGTIELD